MKNKSLAGSLTLFVTAFIWGVAFVFQRSGMDHIGPLSFMAARCVLAVVFLAVLNLAVNKKDAFSFDRPTLTGGILCGLLLTAANNFQQIGMQYTGAGKAGFITALYIILVPVFGVLVLKKKESPRIWAAVALGAAGLYLLCVEEGFSVERGDLWIMACAVIFSWHILVSDKYANLADPIKMSFLQFVVCTVLGTILAFLLETPTWAALQEARVSILYCGILSAGVGYTLQIFGQRSVKPAAASLIMSMESVFAVLSGWLFLQERLSGRELEGCIVMFIAILMIEIPSGKPGNNPAAEG